MNQGRKSRWIGLALTVLLPACVAANSVGSSGSSVDPRWDDPELQKQFQGIYGINSDIEPAIKEIEIEDWNAYVELRNSDPAAARDKLLEVTTEEGSARFDYFLGTHYLQDGDFDEATKHYQNAIDKFPSYRSAHKNLGTIQVRTDDYAGAIKSLAKVVELGGRDGLTFGLLGFAYLQTEHFVSAEGAFREALLLQPDVRDWKQGLVQAVYRQLKYAETVSLCNELIALEPDKAETWLLQANAYIGLEQPLKAAQNYEILDRMGQASAESLLNLGDIYVNEKIWDLARRAYERSLATDGERDLLPLVNRAKVLAERGAMTDAGALITTLKRVGGARLTAEQRRELLKIEARMGMADGEVGEQTIEILQEIVDLDPRDGDALLMLGQHYAKTDPEQAVLYYERAQKVDKFEADALVRHGQLLVEQGRYAEAVPLLKRAQDVKPREQVGRYLEQVQKAAGSGR